MLAERTKRSIDVVVAIVALVASSPVVVLAALAVRVTMGRPVLFRQERAGLEGRSFVLVKLRTMRPPRLGDEDPTSDHRRLTPLGRLLRATSVDELPTLWNVLRGDMSLVGPRPLPTRYLPRYDQRQARRHDVRPGITGWAQIHGRNALSWEDKFDLDTWYVEHWSIWLDLRIIVATFAQVLRREGIGPSDDATMPEFRGRHDR